MTTDATKLKRLAELCGKDFDVLTLNTTVYFPKPSGGTLFYKDRKTGALVSWNPFTSIADAFEVVEAMRKKGYFGLSLYQAEENESRAAFWKFGECGFSDYGTCDAAAISNAALAALEGEERTKDEH